MQCYDCATDQLVTPAVVICSTCGAGLCLNHLVLGHADEWETTVGNPTAMRLPGRRFLCQTCSASAVHDGAEVDSVGTIVNVPGF